MRMGGHFICEASLIQARLHLQSWARDYLVDKVSAGWYLFTSTDRNGDGSPLPTYADIFRACQTLLEELMEMTRQPPPVSLDPIRVGEPRELT